MTDIAIILGLSTATAASLYFAENRTLRATTVFLLLLAMTGKVWRLSHTGRSIYPLEAPRAEALAQSCGKPEDADCVAREAFREGSFRAAHSADDFVRPRVAQLWWFSFCLGLLALRSRRGTVNPGPTASENGGAENLK